jgi:hypothetical protein
MIDNEKQIEDLKERLLVQFERMMNQQILIDELTEAGEAVVIAIDKSRHCNWEDWTASDELTKAIEEWDYIQDHRQSMADWHKRQNMHAPGKESL